MLTIIWVIHLCLCIFLVMVVLLQQGKGADAGALTSSGDSLLGAGAANSFISKLTTATAIAFMVTSVLLVKAYNAGSFLTSDRVDVLSGSVVEGESEPGLPADGAGKAVTVEPAEGNSVKPPDQPAPAGANAPEAKQPAEPASDNSAPQAPK